MASLKIILNPKTNQDGKNSVKLRITHDRKSKYITLFQIKERLFNIEKGEVRKSHPEHEYFNALIEKELDRYTSRIKELKLKKDSYTLDEIINDSGDESMIETHIQKHIDFLKSIDKYQAARKYQNLLTKVNNYKPECLIKDINTKWIMGFQVYLRNQKKINSEQTIARYIKFLKTILNNADKEGSKVNKECLYFKVSIPKSMQTKLTKDEIKSIHEFEDKKLNLTKDTFMLQFLMRGSRIGDVLMLRHEDIRNRKIVFSEQKTKKVKSVAITTEVNEIINKYKGQSNLGYILPWMDMSIDFRGKEVYQKKIEAKTSMINKDLKLIAAKLSIDKRLTSHVARHSFAHISLKSGQDIETIQNMLGHGDIKTTQNYLNTIANQDELNIATLAVTSFL